VTCEHVSWETLGDYCADLLSAEERGHIDRHLASCATCSVSAAEIQHVRTVLADMGGQPLPMPHSVWQRLDSTLAREAEERGRAGAPYDTPPMGGRRRNRVILAAAAAVLAATGTGLILQRSAEPTAHVSASAADSTASSSRASRQPGRQGSAAAAEPLSVPATAPALSPGNLANYARRLTAAEKQDRLSTSQGGGTASASCLSPDVPPAAIVRVIRWQKAPAVVVVSPGPRRVRVLGCRTGTRVLYATSY
jgi:anti-sigma factor RsiW